MVWCSDQVWFVASHRASRAGGRFEFGRGTGAASDKTLASVDELVDATGQIVCVGFQSE